MFDAFLIQNGLNTALKYAIKMVQENLEVVELNYHISSWSMLMMLIYQVKT
jgi:hypothetical protein